jgi:hypothetical protein
MIRNRGHEMGPEWGSHQAVATWQWSNFAHSRGEPGKKRVSINMDETSVRVMGEPTAGFVASRLGASRQHVLEAEQTAPLKSRRTAYTYVAFISDDPDVQAVLPQVLVASARTLTQEAAAAVMADRQDNVYSCGDGRAVGWTRKHLSPYFDCCRQHSPTCGRRTTWC